MSSKSVNSSSSPALKETKEETVSEQRVPKVVAVDHSLVTSMSPSNKFSALFHKSNALTRDEKQEEVALYSKKKRPTGRELLKLQELATAPLSTPFGIQE